MKRALSLIMPWTRTKSSDQPVPDSGLAGGARLTPEEEREQQRLDEERRRALLSNPPILLDPPINMSQPAANEPLVYEPEKTLERLMAEEFKVDALDPDDFARLRHFVVIEKTTGALKIAAPNGDHEMVMGLRPKDGAPYVMRKAGVTAEEALMVVYGGLVAMKSNGVHHFEGPEKDQALYWLAAKSVGLNVSVEPVISATVMAEAQAEFNKMIGIPSFSSPFFTNWDKTKARVDQAFPTAAAAVPTAPEFEVPTTPYSRPVTDLTGISFDDSAEVVEPPITTAATASSTADGSLDFDLPTDDTDPYPMFLYSAQDDLFACAEEAYRWCSCLSEGTPVSFRGGDQDKIFLYLAARDFGLVMDDETVDSIARLEHTKLYADVQYAWNDQVQTMKALGEDYERQERVDKRAAVQSAAEEQLNSSQKVRKIIEKYTLGP